MPKIETAGLPVDSLASLTPRTIDEALDSMGLALRYFRERNDFRAVFLHAYYIITKNVYLAIQEDHRYPIFLDPRWMSRLAGKFATLYFRSLNTFETDASSERAWKLAHGLALEKRSTVIQDLLLGIFAHIKYDLAVAIFQNLREHSDNTQERISLRKADHDHANQILKKSIEEIKRAIPRDYGGLLGFLRAVSFGVDRDLAIRVVQHHRERVWWDAVALFQARTRSDFEDVIEKMNRESADFLERIAGGSSAVLRVLYRCMRFTRKSRLEKYVGHPWPRLDLEQTPRAGPGSAHDPTGRRTGPENVLFETLESD